MNNQRFNNVAVLGAAGKMGSGILYLNTLNSIQLKLAPDGKNQTFVINAIDQSHAQLNALLNYIRSLMLKWAEKNIVWLRQAYADRNDLVENGEIIQAFVTDAMDMIKPSTHLESAYESTLVFEAVLENVELKTKLFSAIKNNNPNNPWFLTNTSSIPINELNKHAGLGGNIIGCHFYNPPAVQKLIEVIEMEGGNRELSELVYSFGKTLGKTMVPANDIAGFIGNGFFMRDLLFALKKLDELMADQTSAEAVLTIDNITRDFMLRPMGIFQLMDYVGIEVCTFILSVMDTFLKEILNSDLLIQLVSKNIKGGQNPDGSQKPGFFTYEKGRIISVYDFKSGSYIPVDQLQAKVNQKTGNIPMDISWRTLSRNKNKESLISRFFGELNKADNSGSQIAVEYMKAMKKIGLTLVNDKVTNSNDNVNTVMITGFHHLYGPINDYC